MKIKMNRDVWKYKAGEVIDIPENHGIPLENFWRRRLRDSAIDGCCEIVVDKPTAAVFSEPSIDREGE